MALGVDPGTKPAERIGECGTSDTFPGFAELQSSYKGGSNPGITLP